VFSLHESAPKSKFNIWSVKISENAICLELQAIEAAGFDPLEAASERDPKPIEELVIAFVVVVVVVVGFLSNPIGLLLLTTELTAAMTKAVVGSSL
jgi:hypothetical protein